MKLLLPLLAVLSASLVHADAFSELRRFAGPSAADLAQVQVPNPAPVAGGAQAKARPVVRVTSKQWDDRFPMKKEAVAAAGLKAGTKATDHWSCDWNQGAGTARCDFAYDVWPEMCWYGYDHVLADVLVKDGSVGKVLARSWRAD